MKYAVIDIGSNSVRLLMWADGRSLYKKINTTRLGEGLSLTGKLSHDAIVRTSGAVREFAAQAKSEGASVLYAFATAAVRRAANGSEFTKTVKGECGIDVDVISGEREAEIGLFGSLQGADGGIIDVGGASSEVTVQKGGKIVYAVSADVGAVRVKDVCGEDFMCAQQFISEKIKVLGQIPRSAMKAVGGTATALAALAGEIEPYDPCLVDGYCLTADTIYKWIRRLYSLSLQERLKLKGMDPKRADILGGGALILYSVMRRADVQSVSVSEKDNMEGYLLSKIKEERS